MQRFEKNHQKNLLRALAYFRKTSYETLFFEKELTLSSVEKSYLDDVYARLLKDEPITKILGQTEFYGNPFFVTHDVLDPRPDTECLIDTVKSYIKPKRILDLGTGSGCILITLLKLFPNASGVGIDISRDALSVCKKNADHLRVTDRCTFIEGSWFDRLSPQKFDCIVSNPPYIQNDYPLLRSVFNYDPHFALFGGADGLDAYRQIFKTLPDYLSDDGLFFAEIGFDQGESICQLIQQFKDLCFIDVLKDFQKNDRVVVVKKFHHTNKI
ncbi:MAG: Release factor glutamine methyltransferase [Holosporales bacterium]